MVQNRNIAMCVILSFVTCGIYGLIWLYQMTNDLNTVSRDPNGTSGGLVILLSIVTCGLYGLYWMYKAGQQLDAANGQQSSNSIIYLILTICGLGIVSYCMIQNELNKFSQ